MIINLIGAPASGKSVFAARFVLEHLEYKYISIDGYRVEYENEDLAWNKLFTDLLAKRNVVLETCGLSWRLRDIFNNETIRRRPMYTIAFQGDIQIIRDRLRARQKREIPYPYTFTEYETVQFVSENMHQSVAQIDYTIDVTSISAAKTYTILCEKIAEQRILTLRSRKRRKEDLLRGLLPSYRSFK